MKPTLKSLQHLQFSSHEAVQLRKSGPRAAVPPIFAVMGRCELLGFTPSTAPNDPGNSQPTAPEHIKYARLFPICRITGHRCTQPLLVVLTSSRTSWPTAHPTTLQTAMATSLYTWQLNRWLPILTLSAEKEAAWCEPLRREHALVSQAGSAGFCSQGDMACVNELLAGPARKLTVKVKNKDGQTPLHCKSLQSLCQGRAWCVARGTLHVTLTRGRRLHECTWESTQHPYPHAKGAAPLAVHACSTKPRPYLKTCLDMPPVSALQHVQSLCGTDTSRSSGSCASAGRARTQRTRYALQCSVWSAY